MIRLTILIGVTAVLASCEHPRTSPTTPPPPSPPTGSVRTAAAEGEYTFTVTADSSCAQLPVSLRSRTYTATVRHDSPQIFAVELSGANFYSRYNEFWILSHGPTHAHFYMLSAYATHTWLRDVPLLERLESGGYFGLNGSGEVTFNGFVPVTPTTFSGEFSYCATPVEPQDPFPPACRQPVTCTSDKHVLSLTRR